MAARADIVAFKRTQAAAWLARAALVAAFVAGLGMLMFKVGDQPLAAVLMVGAGGAYAALAVRSAVISREMATATESLARGELEEAERILTGALRRFSLYPHARIIELYHLAVLRQNQGRHAEAAELSGAIAGRRRVPGAIAGAARLIRLESMLALDELEGAHAALVELEGCRLDLEDSVRLLAAGVRYGARIGAWEHMLAGLGGKLRLADLMPPGACAGTMSLLALGARKTGREGLGRWLLARALAMSDNDRGEVHAELLDWAGGGAGGVAGGAAGAPGGADGR